MHYKANKCKTHEIADRGSRCTRFDRDAIFDVPIGIGKPPFIVIQNITARCRDAREARRVVEMYARA